MHVTNMDGSALEQAGVGQPFLIQVDIKDIPNTSIEPVIQNTDNIAMHQMGVKMADINGNARVTYIYKSRIDNPGNYTIGPATITLNGSTTSTSAITLTVANTAKLKNSPKKQEHFLKLEVDKDQLVVGEQAVVTLSLYTTSRDVQPKQVAIPTLQTVSLQKQDFEDQKEVDIAGKKYFMTQWRWYLYPKEKDRLVIPAWSLEFEQPRRGITSFYSFFGTNETKRIYSNALELHIDPLPEQPIDFVGSDVTLTASVDHASAKVGEAFVLTLTLAARGNVAEIKELPLRNMPEQTKYYDSTHRVVDATPLTKKEFEYVVQGLSVGSVTIPAQAFTYYDTHAKEIKTVQTTPVVCTILPGAHLMNHRPTVIQSVPSEDIQKVDALPIKTDYWYAQRERTPFNWWLFGFLFFLPGGIIIARRFRKYQFNDKLLNSYQRKKFAFSIAMKEFQKLKQQNNAAHLYNLFVTLFSDLLAKPKNEVTQEFLKQYVAQITQVDQWVEFVDELAVCAFAPDSQNRDGIFNQANFWLITLQKKL